MIKFFFFFLLVCVTGCASSEIKRVNKPDGLIPETKMIQVLKDLTVMEAHVQQKYPSIQQNYKVMIETGDAIFKKHGIDSLAFKESMDYYGSRQEKMQELYSKVLDQINSDLAKEQVKK